MTKKHKSTKQLGKAAVVLVAFGSLLGIGVSPAIATEATDNRTWDITVTVTDSSVPPCSANYSPASWDPDNFINPNFDPIEIDLASPRDLEFDISLKFEDGVDQGDCVDPGPNVEPSGTVTAEYSVLPNELVGTVNCNPPGCNAAEMSNFFGGVISGTLALKEDVTPGTYLATPGAYLATLLVVWTP